MELNPNLSEKGKHDYALILRATEESDQKAYAELMERYILVNSGDPLHQDGKTPDFPKVTNDPNEVTTKAIRSIKFQLSFKK